MWGWHSCGLRTDRTIQCWGHNGLGQTNGRDGQFTAVAAGGRHSCGLRTDGAIQCWGSNSSRQTNAPEGQFTAVMAATWHSCGVRTDNTIQCWGNNEHGQADAPEGQFTAGTVGTVGTEHSCGLRTDNTIQCWGNYRYRPWAEPMLGHQPNAHRVTRSPGRTGIFLGTCTHLTELARYATLMQNQSPPDQTLFTDDPIPVKPTTSSPKPASEQRYAG